MNWVNWLRELRMLKCLTSTRGTDKCTNNEVSLEGFAKYGLPEKLTNFV